LYSAKQKTWHASLLYLYVLHDSPFYCPGFDISSIETHQVLAALH